MAIAFDTLAYARKLKEAGFSDQQAEVQAQALAEIVDERLATKQDIFELQRATKQDILDSRRATEQDILDLRRATEQDILDLGRATKQDILDLRRDMQRDMQDMEYRLTLRLGTMIAIAVTAVAALVKPL